MTNREKFRQIFGFDYLGKDCPVPWENETCQSNTSCLTCPYFHFWDKEYNLDKEKGMYVERTFESIKAAGDYIAEHGISRDDIIEITLHTSDNGVTITFTTEGE